MASAFIIAQTEAVNQQAFRYLSAVFSLKILHGEGAFRGMQSKLFSRALARPFEYCKLASPDQKSLKLRHYCAKRYYKSRLARRFAGFVSAENPRFQARLVNIGQ